MQFEIELKESGDLGEAATVKSRARGLLRSVRGLLKDKSLPGSVRKALEGVSSALGKTWKDLADDADADPSESARLAEAAILGNWLEARLHSTWTNLADEMFGSGYLSRAERIALSGAIGDALTTFNESVMEAAPQIYERGPWDGPAPEPPADDDVGESDAVGLLEAAVPLVEQAVRPDGTIPIKIIQPGWGSSGYYPADVLERDGPKVFKAGLKMYWNHPTPTEESERPERDLRDLSAELVSDARWEANHPQGPGLYAESKVFQPYRPAVDELAPHIGVSIRARGRATAGSAEGRSGPIIQEITAARSVDFVTTPGAGGKVLQLFEARRGAGAPAHKSGGDPVAPVQEEKMDPKEAQALKDANARLEGTVQEQAAQIARLMEGALLREAGDVVTAELADATLPKITLARLKTQLSANPPVKDGVLDREALKTRIAEAVKMETAYLAEVAGGGEIRGLGSAGNAAPETPKLDESAGRTSAALARIGYAAGK